MEGQQTQAEVQKPRVLWFCKAGTPASPPPSRELDRGRLQKPPRAPSRRYPAEEDVVLAADEPSVPAPTARADPASLSLPAPVWGTRVAGVAAQTRGQGHTDAQHPRLPKRHQELHELLLIRLVSLCELSLKHKTEKSRNLRSCWFIWNKNTLVLLRITCFN